MSGRDFLDLRSHSRTLLNTLLDRASWHKLQRKQRLQVSTMTGCTLINVFEKASTRTRASFEAAVQQLGGHAVTIDPSSSQLARGEPIDDTARVLSRYADVLMFRTFGDDRLHKFAQASSVPVINGLSEGGHPVQLMADLMTVREAMTLHSSQEIVFLGDCASNMALSWMEAARVFQFRLRLVCPPEYAPNLVRKAPYNLHIEHDIAKGLRGADVINTDVWTSMGQEAESKKRLHDLASYSLTHELLAKYAPRAIVLHCLPAHRGEEISDEVLMGKQSRVWDQAENRLHVQKAILEWCVNGD
jgi:ornithine carbamoyltransferase